MQSVRTMRSFVVLALLLASVAWHPASAAPPVSGTALLRAGTGAYTAYYKTLDGLGWSTVLAPANLAQPGGVAHAERVLADANTALDQYAAAERAAFTAAGAAMANGTLGHDSLLDLLPGVHTFVARDVALEHQKLKAVGVFLAALDRQRGRWHLDGTNLVFDAGTASPDARAAYGALAAVQGSIQASRRNWQTLQQAASGHRLALLRLAPQALD